MEVGSSFVADTKPFELVQPYSCVMHHRRVARDYEAHPHRSEAMIKVAMVDLIRRLLTANRP